MPISTINNKSIADGTVIAADILDGTISSSKLVSANIAGDRIAANTLSNTVFQTGSVESYMRAVNLDFGLRNRIINGDMRIDQRNNGAAVTPVHDGFAIDRYKWALSQSAKLDVQQDSSANTVAGFSSSMKVTSSSSYSVGSSDYFFVRQDIEGNNVADLRWGTANARPITLSFWVRSSLTGTFGGSLRNSAGDRAYPFSYTINSANTWEYETITIPGDTSGTWLTTNGIGISCSFGLGVGSSFSGTAGSWQAGNLFSSTGAVSVVGTNAATWYVTGVQLEEGSQPTPFEYRQTGTELNLCQRYYKRITRANSNGSGDAGFLNFCDWNGTEAYTGILISPSMRTAPSYSYSALGDFKYLEGGSVKTPTAFQLLGASPEYVELKIEWTGGLTAGRAGWLRIDSANGWAAFSAEL
jgi:hypothetical protein